MTKETVRIPSDLPDPDQPYSRERGRPPVQTG